MHGIFKSVRIMLGNGYLARSSNGGLPGQNTNGPSIGLAEAMAQLLEQGYKIQSFETAEQSSMTTSLLVK
jgi:hypothetical protein